MHSDSTSRCTDFRQTAFCEIVQMSQIMENDKGMCEVMLQQKCCLCSTLSFLDYVIRGTSLSHSTCYSIKSRGACRTCHEQDEQCTYKRKNKERLRNHSCSVKATRNILSVRL